MVAFPGKVGAMCSIFYSLKTNEFSLMFYIASFRFVGDGDGGGIDMEVTRVTADGEGMGDCERCVLDKERSSVAAANRDGQEV